MQTTVPASETQNTTAAHLEQARRRARGLFGAEVAHDRPYELVHAATAGRDSVVVVLMLWAVLVGIGALEHAFAGLLAAAMAAAVHTGISNALAVYAQLRYWEAELVRERNEIRSQPEHEREELRMLYQAKGFSGELLETVVDTICNDEERLLKVMLEEELGIFFEQRNHPIVTGLFTGITSLASGVLVALAAGSGQPVTAIITTAIVLAILCLVRHGLAVRAGIESFARWTILAGMVAGIAYLLGRLFVGFAV
jgi:VIT1/CCC1 family predicted Fe2+/Mn2+ transporter